MYSVDRISYLPPNITEHILQFVTLKDAVRTSILSTHWRYKWTILPQFILDSSFFCSVIKKFRHDEKSLKLDGSLDASIFTFSNIVNNVLFRQDGPIHKFVLHLPCWFPHEGDISLWIHFLSAKSVKRFTLVNLSNDRKLPSWFCSCAGFTHLTHLTLINLILPSISTTFMGFPLLVTLKLHRSFQNENGVANMVGILVSKCPNLKTLDLKMYDKEGRLNIQAQKLQHLSVCGRLFGIFLKETKRIQSLYLLCELDEQIEFFACFPLMKRLVLHGHGICMEPGSTIVEDCYFQHLKSAHIIVGYVDVGISLCYEIALEFIKNILSLSPVLKSMIISLKMKDEEKLNFATELLRYRRASTSAEIIFKTA